ncbi:hypothetical protein AMTR_s00060p00205900 [Amborella trichopoda]|uniref:Retrovirus-related Pol polyprotein from transposon TNT 1-94-like beta-barrel domain-containing protein n=1 Tax=Amborella trichopoda TaxID=13333 RepID=W1NL20_AMBTC|nr:hypothetical protein AMTR_s00060p00205900 [Amborella trichopoda]
MDGFLPSPIEFLPIENNEESKIILVFLYWKKQDQLLLSWLVSFLKEGVHAQIMGLTTSHETSINAKSDPLTLNDLYGILLSQEVRLSDQHDMLDIGSPSANLATTLKNNSRRAMVDHGRGGHGRGCGQGHGQQQNNNYQCGKQQGSLPHVLPSMQLCGPLSTPVSTRFNHAFQPELNVNLNAFHANHSNIDDASYPNSGASKHIPVDLSNLSLLSKYIGLEQIKIGNGTSLSINNIGSSNLLTSNATFSLCNILYVPSICQNLLSVNQFTKYNYVVFEFHPSHFVVKDQSTGRALMHGLAKDSLYQLEVANKRNNKSTGSTFLR